MNSHRKFSLSIASSGAGSRSLSSSLSSSVQFAEQAFYIAFLSGFLVMAGSFLSQVLSVHSPEQSSGVATQAAQVERVQSGTQAAS